ncbi:MAG: hypothetical protein KC656_31315, partial [Myxococcales bacterium]|nr:hypothetical protein [Myxococcales bacterium]
FDLDLRKPAIERARGDRERSRALQDEVAAEGLRLLAGLRSSGLDPVLVDSGYKGRHLWCFLPEPVPAARARAAMVALARALGVDSPNLHLELFPKQDGVAASGLGNLVKLPLGVHRRTGRRCVVLDEDGTPHPHPIERILTARRVGLDELVTPHVAPATPTQLDDAPPAPPVESRAWAEADFEGSREVGPILQGCPVLRHVVRRGLEERALSHEEVITLEHTLGHTADGVRAVNYLLERVPGVPQDVRMGAPLRGNPTSCKSVRKRLPEVVSQTGCACVFPEVSGRYPNPLRHLETAIVPEEPESTLHEDLEAYGRQLERVRLANAELDDLRARVIRRLGDVGGSAEHLGGTWSVEGDQVVYKRAD